MEAISGNFYSTKDVIMQGNFKIHWWVQHRDRYSKIGEGFCFLFKPKTRSGDILSFGIGGSQWAAGLIGSRRFLSTRLVTRLVRQR